MGVLVNIIVAMCVSVKIIEGTTLSKGIKPPNTKRHWDVIIDLQDHFTHVVPTNKNVKLHTFRGWGGGQNIKE